MNHFDAEKPVPLTARQSLAVPIVAASPSLAAASRAARISRATLRRWMEEPRFRDELERARQNAVEFAYSEVQALALKSVNALAGLLEDPDPRVRASAVRISLHNLHKIEADRNLQQRIDILEDAFDLLQAQR